MCSVVSDFRAGPSLNGSFLFLSCDADLWACGLQSCGLGGPLRVPAYPGAWVWVVTSLLELPEPRGSTVPGPPPRGQSGSILAFLCCSRGLLGVEVLRGCRAPAPAAGKPEHP